VLLSPLDPDLLLCDLLEPVLLLHPLNKRDTVLKRREKMHQRFYRTERSRIHTLIQVS
jgi:hypothetical protein